MRATEWNEYFIKELNRELDTRCNHGVVIFKNIKANHPYRPEYSVTVRGKTIWLESVIWEENRKPYFKDELINTIEKLLTAFYIHIMVSREGRFEGIWISREPDRPAFWGPLGEAVRYLCTFFDLDTTDLDY